MNTIYIAWIIGTKDIVDALRNNYTRVNILAVLGMVLFFHWFGYLRPFDRDVYAVVYDEGSSGLTLDTAQLANGSTYHFIKATSREDMERKMAHQDLGLVIPADFGQILSAGGEPTLNGYIFWSHRTRAAALEEKYTSALTEMLGRPVQTHIGANIIIPEADSMGMQATTILQLLMFIFMAPLFLVPYLVLEEKQTKTMDALLVSPASPGQVVLGKALAGAFYVVVVGGLACALQWFYVTDWGLALLAFLCSVLLAVGVALAIAGFLRSPLHLALWTLPLILVVLVPPLFYMEPALKESLRAVLTWFPTSALASLYLFSRSSGVPLALLWENLAIVLLTIGVVFALLVWQVRRSDR